MFDKFVITGTSSGLGRGLASDLSKSGMNVTGISSSDINIKELINNQSYDHLTLDLNNLDSIAREDISKIVMPSDKVCLIINAAKFAFDDSVFIDTKAANQIFNINYHSAVILIRLFKKNLKRVIFVNSISGLNSQANQSQYSASKHALQAYSEVLAKESISLDFDVMSINPGGIKTPLWSKIHNHIDQSNFLEVETVVSTIKFLITLPANTYVKNLTLLPCSDVMNN